MSAISPSTSPPRTPGEREYRSSSAVNTPNSDDSSIIEDLSFDYVLDDEGNIIRLSKGSTKSNHSSSPPTPQDVLKPELPSKSPSPELLSPVARVSLSRSESAYPVLSGPGAGTSSTSAALQNDKPARSFQRVASGSAITSSSSYLPPGTSAAKARVAARRITLEDPRARQDSFGASKAARPNLDSNINTYTLQEEKENISEADDQPYVLSAPAVAPKLQTRSSPPLVSRSVSSASSRVASSRTYLASGSSSTSAMSRVSEVAVPQRERIALPRQIVSGAGRPGRIMKTTSASKYSNLANYDRISEVETSDNEYGAGQHSPMGTAYVPMTGDETEPEDEAVDAASIPLPSSVPSNSLRTRVPAPSSLALNQLPAPAALLQISASRPRRSASMSEAANNDDYHLQVQQQYQNSNSRPGTSLGLNNDGPGARRIGIQQREKQDQEFRAEYKQDDADRHSPSPTHNQAQSSRTTYGHRRRDSDTLRNVVPPLSAASVGSPTVVEHQRRSSPSSRVGTRYSPPNTLVKGRSSPPVVKGRVPPASKGRLSPSASSNLGAAREVARHRRSPTAPQPSTLKESEQEPQQPAGKTWAGASGEKASMRDEDYEYDRERERERERDREREKERERERDKRALQSHMPMQHVAQQPHYSQSLPSLAAQTAQSQMPAATAQRHHIVVNKKAYARLDIIGKGGSSRVYRVLNNANELYAIKRVSLDKTDAETMSGYMNEIALLKRLEGNSRIIRLIDSELRPGPGGSKGHLLLVMECGEIDLARLLQEQMRDPLNMVWVAYYWQQMLQAVHVIHEEKIVHSDLKPANFVLVRGQLKLIDFGIANAIANDTTNIQRDHQIGTVNYMSPEAIELPDGMRRLKVGRPSDVWSLGCILYQMIYGYPPFHHLKVYQKMKAIPDGTHIIHFDEYAIPVAPSSRSSMSDSQGQADPPKKLDHLKVRVRQDVIASMKSCLLRDPKARATIPELLDHKWLSMEESSPAPAPNSVTLRENEAIINPYHMRQLLLYGISQAGRADDDSLLKEAERLVQELKSVYQSH
ncbi:Pkinase-domain-containing protein [Agrocybe pediades]|nr:Pkinase-domain-containing protein [Agrocybe pediades]